MKKIGLGILTVLIVLSVSGVATAMIRLPAADQAKGKITQSSIIEMDGDDLRLTPPGLEKIVFIHYKKGFAKPDWAGKGKGDSKCYDFLGKGVKWKEGPVDYVIDPDNQDGLTENFVTNAIYLGVEEWDTHTNAELFGDYSVDYNASWDSDAPDGRNELLFGDYPQEGVIAVTVIWGYFGGRPSTREIIEFDILFDDNDFTWGDADNNPSVMDLQNIAVHELGHGVGLADIYETACSEVTMYGYSGYGDIEKRTLAPADIIGIQTLYGL